MQPDAGNGASMLKAPGRSTQLPGACGQVSDDAAEALTLRASSGREYIITPASLRSITLEEMNQIVEVGCGRPSSPALLDQLTLCSCRLAPIVHCCPDEPPAEELLIYDHVAECLLHDRIRFMPTIICRYHAWWKAARMSKFGLFM